jgi:CHASE2 domain-containing sensor protein
MGTSKKPFIRSLCLGGGVSALVFLLSLAGFLRKWENGIFDFMMWWETEKVSSDILMVDIDSADYKSVFHSTSPLSRRILAEAILKLARSRPKVIGLDVSLSTETDEDKDLIAVVQNLDRNQIPIVFPISENAEEPGEDTLRAVTPSSAQLSLPLAALNHVFFGGVDYVQSSDGVIREVPLLKIVDRTIISPSFPLSIVAASTGITRLDLRNETRQNRPNLEAGSDGFNKIRSLIKSGRKSPLQKIHFIGNARSFNSLKFSQVYKLPPESFQPGNIFTDKIILLGGDFEESRDFYMTPKGRMSGVEIIANSVETLLHSNPILPINHILELLIELALVFVLSYFFLRFSPLKASLLSATSILPLAILGSALAFSNFGRWLNFIPAALTVFLHGEFSLLERYSYLKNEIVALTEHLSDKDREIARLRRLARKNDRSNQKRSGIK